MNTDFFITFIVAVLCMIFLIGPSGEALVVCAAFFLTGLAWKK